MEATKKPYTKPTLADADIRIGELKASPELIAEIRETVERCQAENARHRNEFSMTQDRD